MLPTIAKAQNTKVNICLNRGNIKNNLKFRNNPEHQKNCYIYIFFFFLVLRPKFLFDFTELFENGILIFIRNLKRSILEMAGVERQLFFNIKKRKTNYYRGHILREEKYSLLYLISEGKIERRRLRCRDVVKSFVTERKCPILESSGPLGYVIFTIRSFYYCSILL